MNNPSVNTILAKSRIDEAMDCYEKNCCNLEKQLDDLVNRLRPVLYPMPEIANDVAPHLKTAGHLNDQPVSPLFDELDNKNFFFSAQLIRLQNLIDHLDL